MARVRKPTKAWAGYSEGKLHTWPANDGYAEPGTVLEVFTTRKAARARYEDVRRVEIRELRAPKGK